MQNNSITSQTDIANVTVITEENQIIVPQPITNVIEVNNPGPQGPQGPQGITGPQGIAGPTGSSQPFSNVSGSVWATTSSIQVSGSFLVSGSSTFTNIGPAIFSSSLNIIGKIGLNDGGNSVYVGNNVGTIDDTTNNRNVGIGYNVLYSSSTGNFNVGIGAEVLTKLTSNQYNVAIGYATLTNNIADNNTAVGIFSLNQNTTGNFNNGFGTNTLLSCSVGANNVAVGSSVMRNLTSGSNNTGIGSSALLNIITGSGNVAVGSNAGRYFGTGTSANSEASSSVFLGRNTRANASGESNQIVIGFDALGLGSNTVVLGNDSITRTALKGSVSIGTTGSISSTLHVKGAGATSGTTALRVENTNASVSLIVRDDGNVGIGTATPAYKLDVSGSVNISNILTLTPQSPLPSGIATGSFAVSSSVPPKPYFYDGTTWNALY
jgi:hypothetical protein